MTTVVFVGGVVLSDYHLVLSCGVSVQLIGSQPRYVRGCVRTDERRADCRNAIKKSA